MSFLHPSFLYYMLPPLIVFFIFLLRKKEPQADFFSEEVMQKLRVGEKILSLRFRNISLFFMSVCIIIALAEPVIKKGKVEVKSKSADIIIALDISDSMLAEDVYPNRLKFAKSKALEFLRIASNERIGILAFAKNAYLVSPMSFDHEAVGFLLRQLSTDSITQKGTNFLSLLNAIENSIETRSKKQLLIISDGGDGDDFSEEIAYAKEKNIRVFVLAIATEKGAPIKQKNGSFVRYKGETIVSKLNPSLASFATSTGGVYIKGMKSNEDIKTMLGEIQRVSEKKELKKEIVEKFIPLFYYPLGLALVLLLLATSSLRGKTSALFVFALFSIASVDSKAGLLDFMDLEEARQAYKSGNYEKSAGIYAKYADDTGDAHSYFNAGNSFYKQKKYKDAVKLYEKAVFKKLEYKANRFANLGNSHAKLKTQENLEKAKKYYEESLKLVDDENIKKNLEEVKKRIKEKEKNKEDKDGKDRMNKNKDEPKDSNNMRKKNKKDDIDEKKLNKQDDEKKEKKALEQSQGSKNKVDTDSKEVKSDFPQKQKMSDAEERKWLDSLNKEQSTYMYLLDSNEQKKENVDEKPW